MLRLLLLTRRGRCQAPLFFDLATLTAPDLGCRSFGPMQAKINAGSSCCQDCTFLAWCSRHVCAQI